MINSVVIYAPTKETFYKVGFTTDAGATLTNISVFLNVVTIHFDDGAKLRFVGLPYSIELF